MSRFQVIKGIPFPNVPWFKRENIEGTLEYLPRDGDIIIASYPKTGTTWLQYIVIQITSKGESFPSFNDMTYKVAPFMEMAGPDAIDNLKGLRIYKHHYRYDMVIKNPKSKVLYIYRNPEDTFVSFYHFFKDIHRKQLNLEETFDDFLTGNVEYGSYFKHVLSFLNHKDDDNLLLISYEKLQAEPKDGILRIAKFLGEEYYQSLSADELLLNKIIKNTGFSHMKQNIKVELPLDKSEGCSEDSTFTVNFFRKGVVGDGKNSLSTEHVKRLRDKIAEVMEGSEILKEWIKE